MTSPLVANNITKRFGANLALRSINLEIPAGRAVGLLGRNGAGKTTLLNIFCGLVLPTEGSCVTLGKPSRDLDAPELSQLGVVFQEANALGWMTVERHLAFTGSFYPRWDQDRQERLLKDLELDRKRKISQLSTGDQQKLSIILAVCHHPALVLLDEPISALDPIARKRMLDFLVELLAEDQSTVVISSHILNDVEKIIDWVVCLDEGELAISAPFDEVQESYAEWVVTTPGGALPSRFPEPFILTQEINSHQARLCVRTDEAAVQRFRETHHAEVASRPLNLEQLFPLLIKERRAKS